jgi:hypothetical protein
MKKYADIYELAGAFKKEIKEAFEKVRELNGDNAQRSLVISSIGDGNHYSVQIGSTFKNTSFLTVEDDLNEEESEELVSFLKEKI